MVATLLVEPSTLSVIPYLSMMAAIQSGSINVSVQQLTEYRRVVTVRSLMAST
jgi:hypothetical protein